MARWRAFEPARRLQTAGTGPPLPMPLLVPLPIAAARSEERGVNGICYGDFERELGEAQRQRHQDVNWRTPSGHLGELASHRPRIVSAAGGGDDPASASQLPSGRPRQLKSEAAGRCRGLGAGSIYAGHAAARDGAPSTGKYVGVDQLVGTRGHRPRAGRGTGRRRWKRRHRQLPPAVCLTACCPKQVFPPGGVTPSAAREAHPGRVGRHRSRGRPWRLLLCLVVQGTRVRECLADSWNTFSCFNPHPASVGMQSVR